MNDDKRSNHGDRAPENPQHENEQDGDWEFSHGQWRTITSPWVSDCPDADLKKFGYERVGEDPMNCDPPIAVDLWARTWGSKRWGFFLWLWISGTGHSIWVKDVPSLLQLFSELRPLLQYGRAAANSSQT